MNNEFAPCAIRLTRFGSPLWLCWHYQTLLALLNIDFNIFNLKNTSHWLVFHRSLWLRSDDCFCWYWSHLGFIRMIYLPLFISRVPRYWKCTEAIYTILSWLASSSVIHPLYTFHIRQRIGVLKNKSVVVIVCLNYSHDIYKSHIGRIVPIK